jgi:hypothetical protein
MRKRKKTKVTKMDNKKIGKMKEKKRNRSIHRNIIEVHFHVFSKKYVGRNKVISS